MSEYILPNNNVHVVLSVKNGEGQVLRRELHQVALRFEMEVTEDELGEGGTAQYIEENALPDLVSALTGETIGTPSATAQWTRSAAGDVVQEGAPPPPEADDSDSSTSPEVASDEERPETAFSKFPLREPSTPE